MKVLALFMIGLSLSCITSQASAQELDPYVISICDAATDSPAAILTAARLCAHLPPVMKGLDGHVLVPVDQLLSTHEAFDPRQSLEDTVAQCRAAKEQAKPGGKLRRATKLLDACMEGLLATESWHDSSETLIDALLLRASLSLRQRQDHWMADRALVRLLNFFPGLDLSTLKLSAALSARLRDMRQTRQDVAQGALNLDSEQGAVEVTLDGRYLGVTPLRVPNLSAGEHLLRTRKTGFVPQSHVVTVSPAGTTPFKIDLAPSYHHDSYMRALAQIRQEVGQVRGEGGMDTMRSLFVADRLVAVRVFQEPGKEARLEGWLYDLRSWQLLAAATVPVDIQGSGAKTQQSMEQLITGLQTALANRTSQQVVAMDPWWSSWWFWAGAALVTASAVTVGVLVLQEEDPPAPSTTGTLDLRF